MHRETAKMTGLCLWPGPMLGFYFMFLTDSQFDYEAPPLQQLLITWEKEHFLIFNFLCGFARSLYCLKSTRKQTAGCMQFSEKEEF